jgi:hypothetical protein
MPVISVILVIMIALALVTNFIGVHTVLGAFAVGIMMGQSPILIKHIEEQLRGLIVALFMPIFFGVAGSPLISRFSAIRICQVGRSTPFRDGKEFHGRRAARKAAGILPAGGSRGTARRGGAQQRGVNYRAHFFQLATRPCRPSVADSQRGGFAPHYGSPQQGTGWVLERTEACERKSSNDNGDP